MKALTLHQPWASLIAAGVKTIETRSWSTRYRGPLAIHAGKHWPESGYLPPLKRDGTREEQDAHNHQTWLTFTALERGHPCGGDATRESCRVGRHHGCPRRPVISYPSKGPWARPEGEPRTVDLPLGAVVATCTLVDVVPITDKGYYPPGTEETWVARWDADYAYLRHRRPGIGVTDRPVTDQLPFGDFTPGRYAWFLTDITSLAEPVPAKGRQGLWEWTRPESGQ